MERVGGGCWLVTPGGGRQQREPLVQEAPGPDLRAWQLCLWPLTPDGGWLAGSLPGPLKTCQGEAGRPWWACPALGDPPMPSPMSPPLGGHLFSTSSLPSPGPGNQSFFIPPNILYLLSYVVLIFLHCNSSAYESVLHEGGAGRQQPSLAVTAVCSSGPKGRPWERLYCAEGGSLMWD